MTFNRSSHPQVIQTNKNLLCRGLYSSTPDEICPSENSYKDIRAGIHLKHFGIESAYFWTARSSCYSLGRSHAILMTKFITSILSFLKALRCRSSMISGSRNQGWPRLQPQRPSRELVYVLGLFQINCLGSVVGTWAVGPNAEGQAGERKGTPFIPSGESWRSQRPHWAKGAGEKHDWEWEDKKTPIGVREPVRSIEEIIRRNCGERKVLDSRYSQRDAAQRFLNWCGCFWRPVLCQLQRGVTGQSLCPRSPQSPRETLAVLLETRLSAISSSSFLCFPTSQQPVCFPPSDCAFRSQGYRELFAAKAPEACLILTNRAWKLLAMIINKNLLKQNTSSYVHFLSLCSLNCFHYS